MDNKYIVILIVAAIVGFWFWKQKNTVSPVAPSPTPQIVQPSPTPTDPQQAKCESIVPVQEFKTFSGKQYTFIDEGTGFVGKFSCYYYLPDQGLGVQMIYFNVVDDENKVAYKTMRDNADDVEDAPSFGENAFYSKIVDPDDKSALPEWQLIVNKYSKTYTINVPQYRSEVETKNEIKSIYDRFIAADI